MASQKQVNYAMMLMRKAGYSTDGMKGHHADLGAKMRERSGSVKDWLEKMNHDRISALIDSLKEEGDME